MDLLKLLRDPAKECLRGGGYRFRLSFTFWSCPSQTPIQAEVVQYLLDGYPEGLDQVDDEGDTVLHNDGGDTVLHYACGSETTLDMVKLLIH